MQYLVKRFHSFIFIISIAISCLFFFGLSVKPVQAISCTGIVWCTCNYDTYQTKDSGNNTCVSNGVFIANNPKICNNPSVNAICGITSSPTPIPTTPSGSCVSGSKSCNGSQPIFCATTNGQNYSWVNNGPACASGFTCISGACDPCTHTISGVYVAGGYCPIIGGQTLYNCSGGRTVSTSTCTYGCQINANVVDTCKSAPAVTTTPAPVSCETCASKRYACGNFVNNCGQIQYCGNNQACVNSSQKCVNNNCITSTPTPTTTPTPIINTPTPCSYYNGTCINQASCPSGYQSSTGYCGIGALPICCIQIPLGKIGSPNPTPTPISKIITPTPSPTPITTICSQNGGTCYAGGCPTNYNDKTSTYACTSATYSPYNTCCFLNTTPTPAPQAVQKITPSSCIVSPTTVGSFSDYCNGKFKSNITMDQFLKNKCLPNYAIPDSPDPISCNFDSVQLKNEIIKNLQAIGEYNQINVDRWMTIAYGESRFHPWSINGHSTSGTAWGLFQMNDRGYNNPTPQYSRLYDSGNVDWKSQVRNAIYLNKYNQGGSYCYWAVARGSCFAAKSCTSCKYYPQCASKGNGCY